MARIDPKELRQRFEHLKEQRTSWEPMWRDIRDFILPDFGVFDGEDPTSGSKRYLRIVDAEATNAADILAAGLLNGVSSPSRPWLRVQLPQRRSPQNVEEMDLDLIQLERGNPLHGLQHIRLGLPRKPHNKMNTDQRLGRSIP